MRVAGSSALPDVVIVGRLRGGGADEAEGEGRLVSGSGVNSRSRCAIQMQGAKMSHIPQGAAQCRLDMDGSRLEHGTTGDF